MSRTATVLDRLQSETSICEDSDFFVIADREPIVTDHRLLVPRKNLPSLADCDLTKLELFLYNAYERSSGTDDYLFERGRAAFCTSMDGPPLAHGHLTAMAGARSIVLSHDRVETAPSLLEALYSIPPAVEYLLWGPVSGVVSFAILDASPPKHLIRNALASARPVAKR